jgi:hypothetical protein
MQPFGIGLIAAARCAPTLSKSGRKSALSWMTWRSVTQDNLGREGFRRAEVIIRHWSQERQIHDELTRLCGLVRLGG